MIRAGCAEDLAAIAEIQALSPEAAQWRPADYLNEDLRVAVRAGRVAGFLVARRIAGATEILTLAVHPEHRRARLARALLEDLLRGLSGPVHLEVRAINHTARRLYKSLGFQEVGVRRAYYADPPDDAVVMKYLSC